MLNQFYTLFLSLFVPFFPFHFNSPQIMLVRTNQSIKYTPVYFDFSLQTYDTKGFDLAKKKCADKLALKIDHRTKRYAESFGYYCTFYGEEINLRIFSLLELNKLKMAADQGNAKDQYALAEAYYYGWYGSSRETEAVKWYQKAADQGLPEAEYQMAWHYERGYEVPQDFVKAMDLYHRAAAHGSEGAQIILAEKYFFGKDLPFGTAIAKDEVQAAKWYEKSAEQGDRNSIYMIGMMYQYGLGVSKDYQKAIIWYQRGIKKGSAASQFGLGYMYKAGEGVPKNYIKARQYFKQACKDLMDEACVQYKKMTH